MTIEKAIEQLEDLIKEAESHMTGNKIDDEIPTFKSIHIGM